MRLKTLFLSLLVLACVSASAFAQSGDPQVRVYHLSTDAPAVDIYVNGAKAFESIPYLGYTDYTPLPAGSIMVEVRVAGSDASTPAVLSATYDLMSGTNYTVMAIGRLDNGTIQLRAMGDDLRDPAMGMGKVRIVHAASNAPAVDVYVTTPHSVLASESPLLTSVPFLGFSSHVEAPEGLYQGRVTVAGTKTVAIDTGAIRLRSGEIRTIVAVDPMVEGAGFGVVVLEDKN